MKQAIYCLAGLAGLAAVLSLDAQEPLPRLEAVRFAVILNFDLDKLADTPISTDADPKRPFGLRAGNRGALVVPETKLTAATLTAAGKQVQPLGQLWLANLVPVRNGQAVPKDQLKMVTAQFEGREVTLPLCLLGVRQAADDKLELLLFGKAKEPLLAVPLTKVARPHQWPLEFDAYPEFDTARITLLVVGKYEASFSVAPPGE